MWYCYVKYTMKTSLEILHSLLPPKQQTNKQATKKQTKKPHQQQNTYKKQKQKPMLVGEVVVIGEGFI